MMVFDLKLKSPIPSNYFLKHGFQIFENTNQLDLNVGPQSILFLIYTFGRHWDIFWGGCPCWKESHILSVAILFYYQDVEILCNRAVQLKYLHLSRNTQICNQMNDDESLTNAFSDTPPSNRRCWKDSPPVLQFLDFRAPKWQTRYFRAPLSRKMF